MGGPSLQSGAMFPTWDEYPKYRRMQASPFLMSNPGRKKIYKTISLQICETLGYIRIKFFSFLFQFKLWPLMKNHM